MDRRPASVHLAPVRWRTAEPTGTVTAGDYSVSNSAVVPKKTARLAFIIYPVEV